MKQFVEIQKFDQWYIWVVPIFALGLWTFAFIKQIIFQIPVGDRPASDLEIMLIGLIPISIIALFRFIKLTTEIDSNLLSVCLFPFCSKSVSIRSIESIEFLTYKFVGYGCRLGTEYGTVLNVKGNQGFQILTKNGDRFLVGTQKSDEIQALCAKLGINIINSDRNIKM